MSKAILVNFRLYTPFGKEFYQPLFNFFVKNLIRYKDEFDKVYFINSNWNFSQEDRQQLNEIKYEIVHVNENLRYYDAYKKVLPMVQEDYVLFLDNDMVIYRKGIIKEAFEALLLHAIASIFDTIGEFKTDKMNGKNKVCPYFFVARREVLMKYLDVDWASNMPLSETFGKLTEAILKDGIIPYEFEEDKSSIYFDGTKDGEKGKDLGYYHIRSGSTPAYLLATKQYGDIVTYRSYIDTQPKREYLRQFAWNWYMKNKSNNFEFNDKVFEFLKDVNISIEEWNNYMLRFVEYHGLEKFI